MHVKLYSYYLAPTMSWFLFRSSASCEKSFTPGWENSDIHGLNTAQRVTSGDREKRVNSWSKSKRMSDKQKETGCGK